jgi:hypothetical protein
MHLTFCIITIFRALQVLLVLKEKTVNLEPMDLLDHQANKANLEKLVKR